MACLDCMYFICICQGRKFEGRVAAEGLFRQPTMSAVIASFLFRRKEQRQSQERPGKKAAPLIQEIFRVVVDM